MIMFVLDDNEFLCQILDAWSNLGVSGATIIDSTGLYRRQLKHVPLRYTYGDQPLQEIGNTTFFAIVEDEKIVHACLDAVEKIVGDLDEPNTGVFTAWPLSMTKGIPSQRGKS